VDDTLTGLALGFFGLLLLHGSLEQRGRHNAERQVREAFGSSGTISAHVAPRGMFGLYAGQISTVDVYGRGVQTDRLPFALYPKRGTFGSIGRLRLHLTDFRLIGLPIRRFDVDVPKIEYDLSHAMFRDRLVLRKSGTGTATVEVDAEGLRVFLLRKYRGILGEVRVSFAPSQLNLRGSASLLGITAPISANAALTVRDGRYVDFVNPSFFLNEQPVSEQIRTLLLMRLNPILDIEDDLGLRGFFRITQLEIGADSLRLTGTITIPEGDKAIATPTLKD
jgi:hypothetical protein